MPAYTEKYPCEVVLDAAGSITIVPMNDKANDFLATFFTASGANTTVEFTQTDAGRGGAGSSLTPYDTLKVASS